MSGSSQERRKFVRAVERAASKEHRGRDYLLAGIALLAEALAVVFGVAALTFFAGLFLYLAAEGYTRTWRSNNPKWGAGWLRVAAFIIICAATMGGPFATKQTVALLSSRIRKTPLQSASTINTAPSSTQRHPTSDQSPLPKTVEDLFKQDFPYLIKAYFSNMTYDRKGVKLPITSQVYMDFQANTKFVGFYIPSAKGTLENDDDYRACLSLARLARAPITDFARHHEQEAGTPGQMTNFNDLRFSGRVMLYTGMISRSSNKQTSFVYTRARA